MTNLINITKIEKQNIESHTLGYTVSLTYRKRNYEATVLHNPTNNATIVKEIYNPEKMTDFNSHKLTDIEKELVEAVKAKIEEETNNIAEAEKEMKLQDLNVSDELKFAVECGIKTEAKVLENGDIQISWNDGKCVEILSLNEVVEEVETVVEFEEFETIKAIELKEQFDLTDKEVAVLDAMGYHQHEDGLPVWTESIAKRSNLTQKQVVGVISSLYKKGFIESYGDDEEMLGCSDMYHLTSEWFEKLNY